MDKFLAKEEFNQLGYRTSTAPARRVYWPWLWLQNCEILVTGVRLWQHLISCDVWFPTLNASRQISDEWRLQREEFQMQLLQFGDQYWNSSEFITFNIRSGEMCFSADEYLFFNFRLIGMFVECFVAWYDCIRINASHCLRTNPKTWFPIVFFPFDEIFVQLGEVWLKEKQTSWWWWWWYIYYDAVSVCDVFVYSRPAPRPPPPPRVVMFG